MNNLDHVINWSILGNVLNFEVNRQNQSNRWDGIGTDIDIKIMSGCSTETPLDQLFNKKIKNKVGLCVNDRRDCLCTHSSEE